MAIAWKKVELYGQNNDGDPRRYTVASGVAIPKGTVLAMTDPRTAAAHSASGQAVAGVAAMAKSATDGSVSISAWTAVVIRSARKRCSSFLNFSLSEKYFNTAFKNPPD